MIKNYFSTTNISFLAFFFFISLFSFGQQTTDTFTTSGTFIVPCGVTSITVQVWGAGGGGDRNYRRAGGGGAFAQSTLNVTEGNSYVVTVGQGGGAGTGNNGGDSQFSTFVIARGGNGGNGGTNAGRGGQASLSVGDITFSGGNGGTSTGNGGAGGGTGAGRINNGANGGNTNTGTGANGGNGTNGGGNGGNGGGTSDSGSVGIAPGGGGGERGRDGNNSGGGGNGVVLIIYTSASSAHCTPSFNNGVEPITNVTFAGINNTTTNVVGGSSLEVFCNTGSVVQGSTTNSISVKGNTVGNFTDFYKVYIDWDQNGVFGNNTNEITNLGTITNSTGVDAIILTGNIAVPATAILGATRMRVIKIYNNNASNPCFSGNFFGQAEDYNITVTAPCPSYSLTSTTGPTACVNSDASIVVNGLPNGNYTITYSTSLPSQTGLTASMTSAGGTGTFTATGLTGNGNSTVTITNISSGSCTNAITSNNTVTVLRGTPPSSPIPNTTSTNVCRSSIAEFSIGAVANASSYLWTTTAAGWTINQAADGLSATVSFGSSAATNGNIVVSAINSCGSNSATISVSVAAVPTVAAIAGGATSVCVNAATPTFTNATSGGTWSITNGTGTASITASGVVTGSTPGTVTVVYTVTSGGCSNTASRPLTVNPLPTVASAGPDQTLCGAGTNGITLAANAIGVGETGIWTFTGSPVITNVNSPTTTVTLAPGTSSTFTWTITRGGCSSSDSVLITNNPSSPISGTLNVCAGATTTLTSSQSPTNSGNWSSATPVVATVSNTGIVTGVAAGTSIITYVNTFGCPSSVTVTVNASEVTPTVVLTVQPNCTLATGSVTLSGLPAGDWDLTQSGFAGATISGTGSERTINGLAPGTYYYTVSRGSCASNVSQAVVIDPVQTTTFNGAGWSSTPTLDKLGIITAPTASPINLSQSIELCSCQVSSGTNVVVDEGIVLKLQDRLVVNPTGSLTFNNNSSLVQINDGANNSGSISYLRQTTVVRKAVDYTYWSSPVAGQNLLAVSPNTNQGRFWSFTPGGTWFVETPSTKIMDIGKGYIIRAPDVYYEKFDALSSVFEATFTGQPNNGNVPVGVAGTFNLIGNPYPSAIDAIEFLEANQSVLNGTIYFWTHNTAIRDAQGTSNEGTGDLVYIQDDYASFNRTGGVATAPATTDPDLASGNPRIPTGKIAAGQSFFASRLAGSSGTTVLFNNSMRLGVGNSSLDNSQFFRTTGTSKKENESTRNRIWLNVTNKQKAFKQILVGYLNGATNDFDPAFDGATYNANTIINFYSMLGTRRLSIQGKALPFDTADIVPLGYNAFIDGEFSISIDNVDGLFSSQAVYLEDKVKNTVHNLKTGPYTFQTVKGAFNDRFVLRYTDRTLGVDDLELKEAQVVISVKNKQLKVTSTADAIKDVYIYDLLGKLIFVKKNIGTDEFLVSNLASSEQVLIVKTVLQNEVVSNLKTIYR